MSAYPMSKIRARTSSLCEQRPAPIASNRASSIRASGRTLSRITGLTLTCLLFVAAGSLGGKSVRADLCFGSLDMPLGQTVQKSRKGNFIYKANCFKAVKCRDGAIRQLGARFIVCSPVTDTKCTRAMFNTGLCSYRQYRADMSSTDSDGINGCYDRYGSPRPCRETRGAEAPVPENRMADTPLKDLGFKVRGFKVTGFKDTEFKDTGFKDTGFGADTILKQAFLRNTGDLNRAVFKAGGAVQALKTGAGVREQKPGLKKPGLQNSENEVCTQTLALEIGLHIPLNPQRTYRANNRCYATFECKGGNFMSLPGQIILCAPCKAKSNGEAQQCSERMTPSHPRIAAAAQSILGDKKPLSLTALAGSETVAETAPETTQPEPVQTAALPLPDRRVTSVNRATSANPAVFSEPSFRNDPNNKVSANWLYSSDTCTLTMPLRPGQGFSLNPQRQLIYAGRCYSKFNCSGGRLERLSERAFRCTAR